MARSATRISMSVHHWRGKLQHERSRVAICDRQTLRAVAQLTKNIRIVRQPRLELLEGDREIVAAGYSEREDAVRGRTCHESRRWFGPPCGILREEQHDVVA